MMSKVVKLYHLTMSTTPSSCGCARPDSCLINKSTYVVMTLSCAFKAFSEKAWD